LSQQLAESEDIVNLGRKGDDAVIFVKVRRLVIGTPNVNGVFRNLLLVRAARVGAGIAFKVVIDD
jgi:hypothetical protein